MKQSIPLYLKSLSAKTRLEAISTLAAKQVWALSVSGDRGTSDATVFLRFCPLGNPCPVCGCDSCVFAVGRRVVVNGGGVTQGAKCVYLFFM